jgi:hypothetical protein
MNKGEVRGHTMQNKNQWDREEELLTSHGILNNLEPLLLLG